MNKLAKLALISLSLSFLPSLLFSCSCGYLIDEFCPTIQDENYIVLAVITELETTNMEVQVLEDIHKETPTETLAILGQDGLNCGASLSFAVGDTMVLSLYHYQIQDAQSGELYSWYLEGCGKSYLTYSDGLLTGGVDLGVNQIPYAEFLTDLDDCIEVSYQDYLNEFAPVGAVWKIRGKNMSDKSQGYISNCETSGCGGSYWQYEVNRKEEIAGKSCSMIEVYYGTDSNDLGLVAEHAVYEDEGRVYFYEPDLDTFFYYHVVQGIGHLGALFGDNQIQIDAYDCGGSFICYQDGIKKYSVYDEYGLDCPCQFQEELTNVDDLTLGKNLKLYPNPSNAIVQVESELPLQSYTIYDLNGKQIMYSEEYSSKVTIALNGMAEGVYMIRLRIGDQVITRKLTKM